MNTPTFELIEKETLQTATNALTFSNIPQNFRDLVLIVNCTTTATSDLLWKANNDSGTKYTAIQVGILNNNPFSNSYIDQTSARAGVSGSTQSSSRLEIFDYSATDKHKASASKAGVSNQNTNISQSRYASLSAINSLEIFSTSTFNIGSTFTLYGIEG